MIFRKKNNRKQAKTRNNKWERNPEAANDEENRCYYGIGHRAKPFYNQMVFRLLAEIFRHE